MSIRWGSVKETRNATRKMFDAFYFVWGDKRRSRQRGDVSRTPRCSLAPSRLWSIRARNQSNALDTPVSHSSRNTQKVFSIQHPHVVRVCVCARACACTHPRARAHAHSRTSSDQTFSTTFSRATGKLSVDERDKLKKLKATSTIIS